MFFDISGLYGYRQRENAGSRAFTEVRPCWTGLISGWVTIWIKYPVLYYLGSQAGVLNINHAFHLYYKCCRWIEFSADLNLTSRVSSGHSGFLPPQNRLLAYSIWQSPSVILGIWEYNFQVPNFKRVRKGGNFLSDL